MSFPISLKNLLGYEKGYANIEGDSGEETYAGISRFYHSLWSGWKIIDEHKKGFNLENKQEFENFKKLLNSDKELNNLVAKFYKQEYWDKFKGDMLPENVSNELLEQSVLLGNWKTAGINLQRALNYLNRNGLLFDDLKVDGYVGSVTLFAVSKVKSERLVKVLNGLQFMHEIKSMDNNPQNEKFVGWFDRT